MAEGDAKLDTGSDEFKKAAEEYMKGSGLHKALESERDARKKLEGKVKLFDGIDLEKVRALMDADRKSEDDKARAAGDFEKLLKQQGEKFEERLKELGVENAGILDDLSGALIDSAAAKAIAKFEGDAELLLPHVKAATKLMDVKGKRIAVVLDESGEPRLAPDAKTATDYMGIEHLVGRWKEKGKFAGAFAGTGASGGGASASTRTGGTGTLKRITLDESVRMDPDELKKGLKGGQLQVTD